MLRTVAREVEDMGETVDVLSSHGEGSVREHRVGKGTEVA